MKINMNQWMQNILKSEKRKACPLMPYLGLELTGKKILEAVSFTGTGRSSKTIRPPTAPESPAKERRNPHEKIYFPAVGNLPAAYLTGLLFGKRMLALGAEGGIADIGLHASTKGNRIYAAIKGVVDAGVDVPHSPEIFSEEERIRGEHIKSHTGNEIVAQFEAAKEKILG